jgi:hypothetical protein
MAIETTYTHLRDELASVLDQVVENQEVVIVRRRGAKDVALFLRLNWPGCWKQRICFDQQRTLKDFFPRCADLRKRKANRNR